MEVVLLWLDDLDDLVFSAALVFERLRGVLLKVGLAASYGIVGAELSIVTTHWAPTLAVVAAASVSAWLIGTTSHALYHRHNKASVTAA
ncbi:MAG TPA: hypothetical protein VIQ99_00770 [Gammaproteobacteria bacterium]